MDSPLPVLPMARVTDYVIGKNLINEMQSETVDFIPVPPPDELDETYASSFDSGPFAPLLENMTSATKSDVHNALHCRQSYRGNMYGKLVKFNGRVLCAMRADRQTYRHDGRNTSHPYRVQRRLIN